MNSRRKIDVYLLFKPDQKSQARHFTVDHRQFIDRDQITLMYTEAELWKKQFTSRKNDGFTAQSQSVIFFPNKMYSSASSTDNRRDGSFALLHPFLSVPVRPRETVSRSTYVVLPWSRIHARNESAREERRFSVERLGGDCVD